MIFLKSLMLILLILLTLYGKEPEMVLIPGGTFQMGSNKYSDEKPVHTVHISSFYMGKYEITNEEYCEFLNCNKNEGLASWVSIIADDFSGIINREGVFDVKPGYEKHPVVYVTWYGSVAYCEWLSKERGEKYYLPSEAEWEYACRAGSTAEYYWGDEIDGDYCFYLDNSESYNGYKINGIYYNHQAVGQKKPNVFCLYDMSGNVWEWCSDRYETYNTGKEGQEVETFMVERGGSWDYFAGYCRSANRSYYFPDKCDYNLGFRICMAK